ncbi:hypothetical protein Taro_018492 [Colocasia esculenta]|uniref:CCHC-type domain-containing protein n=1 Tax=Colocasia esculenta TaxID=4460 RepID=A0A843UWD0_COLES|nr:hypothetical protein [Colocasia esculenta]
MTERSVATTLVNAAYRAVAFTGSAPEPDRGHNISCKGSVDTPHTGVDTMLQALSQTMKKWSSSVDTKPSQVDTRPSSHVSTRDEVVSTLETSPREVFLPVWDSVSTLDQVRSTHSGKCNKQGHMKGECPENKKEKHKKIHKFKKPKAMVATWSDEDSSQKEEEENSSSSESEEICFMVNSSDGKVDTSPQEEGFCDCCVDTSQGKVDLLNLNKRKP